MKVKNIKKVLRAILDGYLPTRKWIDESYRELDQLITENQELKEKNENMITLEQADLLVESYKSVVSELQDFFGTPHIQDVMVKLEEQKEYVELGKAIDKFMELKGGKVEADFFINDNNVWQQYNFNSCETLIEWYRSQKEDNNE